MALKGEKNVRFQCLRLLGRGNHFGISHREGVDVEKASRNSKQCPHHPPPPPSKMHFLEMYSNSPQILMFLALGLFLKSAKIKILT